ncbi:translocation/assembly module TamB domain-containing protein [Rhodovulum sulfidophilum]|uniref:translocation/assembly module TamB domain-containing protein n=1 Tax=Rhodovulum sulfidophilum TaxID=35806 RepID=UPI001924DF01|nr:translocation/assembly module TamB domain-containing protein [Rhodovulum sulfidophilum]MBL3561932.1 translocation/assembly module TamB domain-containing protein [Rhodovulum sulfidophilum]
MRVFLGFLLLLLTALPLAAQEDDRGVLVSFLEDKLSSAGREIRIEGFEGALSSRATLKELTIADEDGVWLTVRGAVLDWSRAALLRGEVKVDELSADEILLPRLPRGGGASVEKSEATPFALPDLPVSIDIGRVRTPRLVLGEALIGQEADLALDGALSLAGGAGRADIEATRSDAEGDFAIRAAYANDSQELSLDVSLTEGAGGIVSSLAGLPGAPPLALTVKGDGPLSDFAADLALATEDEPRVAGRLTIVAPADAPEDRAFAATLSGDLAPLVAEPLRPFFGPVTDLEIDGTRGADRRLDISRLEVSTGALQLGGTLSLAATGLPEKVDLTGRLSGPVLLPVSGLDTTLDGATLEASFDAATGEAWQAAITLDGLASGPLTLAHADLTGTGSIRPQDPALAADIAFRATGIGHAEPALARALGQAAEGHARLSWQAGVPLELTDLQIASGDARLTAKGTLGSAAKGLPFDGRIGAALDDLSRFAALAGRGLGGAARADLSGRYRLLDGIFDLSLDAETTDLKTGTPRLDPLLAGAGQVRLAAARGPEGTSLKQLHVETPGLRLDGQGDLSSAAGGLTLTGQVPDLALVDPKLTGPGRLDTAFGWEAGGRLRLDRFEATAAGAEIAAEGALTPGDPALPAEGKVTLSAPKLSVFSGLAGRPLAGKLDATLSGQGAVKGDFDATLSAEGQGLAIGIAQIDRLIGGKTTIAAAGARKAGELTVGRLDIETPRLTVKAEDSAGDGTLDLTASLSDLALLVEGFPGPVALKGQARPEGADWRLTLNATGPSGTTAAIGGRLARDASSADLSLKGRAPLSLANPFIAPRSLDGMAAYDLTLKGPLGLSALSGRATTSGARLSAPTLGAALTDIGGRVDLSGGRARLDLTGRLGGGQVAVSGPITLSGAFPAELAIRLTRARLQDPTLYETSVDGSVTVTGPLTGGARIAGQLDVGRTEITVPSTGLGGGGELPEIDHVGTPAAVQATLRRAGLVATEGEGGGGRPYPLDLTVNAPSQVFVRGRGIDAELGGRLRLGGSTADVVASGQFELIRGRLDILAQRFTLDEGRVTLSGSFDPRLYFVAATQSGDVTARIVVEGPASAPEIKFSSSPELPQEEVISRILFGRGLDTLSPLQAAELASAVATLMGKGGQGILGALRGATGLDDLDVNSTEEGGTELSAGKYLSDKVYSQVTVNQKGQSEINLNLDVSPYVTLKGHAGAEGDTGIGIFYERDY